MSVSSLLESLGCQTKPLNEKFLLVSSNGFVFYVRTDRPQWNDITYHTLFIYDGVFDEEDMFVDFIGKLKEKVQVVVYVRSERLAMRLEEIKFKETNRFEEIEVDLEEEHLCLGSSSLQVKITNEDMALEDQKVVEEFINKQISQLEEGIGKEDSFTWFDSQYCPINFSKSFSESDVFYAIAKKDGKHVGVMKLLKGIPGFDGTDEVQIENEIIDGCTIDSLRAAVYEQLIAQGYRRLWVNEYAKTDEASKTEVERVPVYIMEYGKNSTEWDNDSSKTNPLSSETWGAKRREV